MINIAICNNKGGVSKTTSAFNVACYFASIGYKVLCVDMDPQANLTESFGISSNEVEGTAYDFMNEFTVNNMKKSDKNIDKYLIKVKENIDLLPANLDLERANMSFVAETAGQLLLKLALKDSSRFYDVCIFDCSPSLSTLTVNVLVVADYLFIPVKSGIFELKGSAVLMDSIERVKMTFNPNLQVGGIFLTQYDGRRIIENQMLETLKELYGEKLLNTTIRNAVAIPISLSEGKPVFEHSPKSPVSKDYIELAKEIEQIVGLIRPRKKKGDK